MFRRLLFPTDFSEHARRSIDCISSFPSIGEIILLHVTWGPLGRAASMKREQEEYARQQLRKEQDRLFARGLHVSIVISDGSSGPVHETIGEVARQKNVDLIVMNPGKGGLITGHHLGSVTHGVIHHASVSVYILPGPVIETLTGGTYERHCPMIFSRVLFATDLSPLSLAVLREFARAPGIGEIRLLHVIPYGEEHSALDERVSQAFILFDQFCAELKKEGIAATGDVLTGDPLETIIRFGGEMDASVVCVVPSGKGKLQEMVSGSITCSLAARNTRPTLLLRQTGHS